MKFPPTFIAGFLLLAGLNIHAQDKLLQGYVAGLKGDTLKGYIYYGHWDISPASIRFKETQELSPVELAPADISGFYVNGELYRSISSSINLQPDVQEGRIIPSDETNGQFIVFAQVLADGTYSLFYFKDTRGRVHFFSRHGGKTEELIYSRSKSIIDGNLVKLEEYKAQLKEIFSNLSQIYSKIDETTFTRNSLSRLFAEANREKGFEPVYSFKVEKTGLVAGITTGISITSMNFSGSAFAKNELMNADFNPSAKADIGLSLEVIFPRNWNHWSVYNELSYLPYSLYSEELERKHENSTRLIKISFDNAVLRLSNLIRYTYRLNPETRFFMNAGILEGILVKNDNKKVIETRFYGEYETVTTPAIDNFKNFELGLVIGAGVGYNRLSIEARYEKNTGIATSYYDYLEMKCSRISFLLNYRFGRQ